MELKKGSAHTMHIRFGCLHKVLNKLLKKIVNDRLGKMSTSLALYIAVFLRADSSCGTMNQSQMMSIRICIRSSEICGSTIRLHIITLTGCASRVDLKGHV